jgi:ribose transport system permease protein
MNNKKLPGILSDRHNRQLLVRRKNDVLLVYAFLIVMIAAALFLSPNFVKPRNLRNLLCSNVGLLLATFSQLIIISLGGVDLSIGSTISVVNVTAVLLLKENPASWLLAFVVCLAIGAGIGFFNGLLVVRGHMQPIIATLATQTVFAGVALLILSMPGGTIPSVLSKFVTKGWNYTVPILIAVLFTALSWILMNRSSFGRSVLATGGNEQSAECTGINVERVKVLAFVAAGVLAAVAGLYITCFTTSGNPLVGEQYTQRSITTAVVAGASLAGGKCSVIGCIAAVLIMGIINNILNLMGISAYYQYVAQGVILIGALALSAVRSEK